MSTEVLDITATDKPIVVKTKVGRPKASKTLIAQKIRERVAQLVVEEVDPVIRAQIKSAIGGFSTMSVIRNGRGDIEKTIQDELAPNHNAAKLLLEFSGAKPADKVQHSGVLGIVALVKKLEQDDAGEMGDD